MIAFDDEERRDLEQLLWHAQLIIAGSTGAMPEEWKGQIKSLGVFPQNVTNRLQKWRNKLDGDE